MAGPAAVLTWEKGRSCCCTDLREGQVQRLHAAVELPAEGDVGRVGIHLADDKGSLAPGGAVLNLLPR